MDIYYFKSRSTPDPLTGCWIWNGFKNKKGYGRFRVNGPKKYAHRVCMEVVTGRDPGVLSVCHTCDNPSCVNPDHLWLGTNADNNRDKMEKGRHRPLIGVKNHQSKMTDDDVRFLRVSAETDTQAADRLGVTRMAVVFARSGRNWKHI